MTGCATLNPCVTPSISVNWSKKASRVGFGEVRPPHAPSIPTWFAGRSKKGAPLSNPETRTTVEQTATRVRWTGAPFRLDMVRVPLVADYAKSSRSRIFWAFV